GRHRRRPGRHPRRGAAPLRLQDRPAHRGPGAAGQRRPAARRRRDARPPGGDRAAQRRAARNHPAVRGAVRGERHRRPPRPGPVPLPLRRAPRRRGARTAGPARPARRRRRPRRRPRRRRRDHRGDGRHAGAVAARPGLGGHGRSHPRRDRVRGGPPGRGPLDPGLRGVAPRSGFSNTGLDIPRNAVEHPVRIGRTRIQRPNTPFPLDVSAAFPTGTAAKSGRPGEIARRFPPPPEPHSKNRTKPTPTSTFSAFGAAVGAHSAAPLPGPPLAPASNPPPAGRNRPASPVSPHQKGRHPPPERISSTEKNAHGALFRTTPLPARKKGGGLRRPARLPTRKGAPCPRTPPPAPAGRPRPGWAPWPWAPPSPPPPPPPPTSTPPRSG